MSQGKQTSSSQGKTRLERDHKFAQEIGAMGGKAKAKNNKSKTTNSKSSGEKKTILERDHEFAQEIGAMGGKAKGKNKNKSN